MIPVFVLIRIMTSNSSTSNRAIFNDGIAAYINGKSTDVRIILIILDDIHIKYSNISDERHEVFLTND